MEQPTSSLCECGCGKPAYIYRRTDKRFGTVKGTASRFARGHSLCGAGHFRWTGEDASYGTIHQYIRKHFVRAGACEQCGVIGPTDWALVAGRCYSRDRDDYRELCRRCHVLYDKLGYLSYWKRRGQSGDPEGDAPCCACGCGELTAWNRQHKRWNRYVAGHYRRDALYKNEGWLREQRLIRGRSVASIAADCGVNRTTVAAFIAKFGIEHPDRALATRVFLATCAHCGIHFPARPKAGAERRFCSKTCKSAWRRATRADDVTKTCHQCGASFSSNKYDTTSHCSQSCAATCQHAGGCPR